MSVYIKGMEMPEGCHKCRFLNGDPMDGLCQAAEKWLDDDYFCWYQYPEGDIDDSKPLNCPLIPVPDHGRLVEEDAAYDKIAEAAGEESGNYVDMDVVGRGLENTPTIIPADRKEEEA